MTDMIERAATAIADKWLEKVDDSTVRVGPPVIARAALLAALDPEDEALVETAAREICNCLGLHADDWSEDLAGGTPTYVWQTEADTARAAIAALRRAAQEPQP